MAKKEIENTIKALCLKRPFLKPILESFAPVFILRNTLVPEIRIMLEEKGIKPAEFCRELARKGVPLFSDIRLDGIGDIIRHSANATLPLFNNQPVVAPWLTNLKRFYLDDPENDGQRQKYFDSMLIGAYPAMNTIAEKADIPPEIMEFTGSFISSSIMRALLALVPRTEKNEFPWDEEGLWNQGYCPACGSPPSLAWFDRPRFDDADTFISGGGGKKHFHCTQCGGNWKFRRGVCPGCGKEGDGVMGVLRPEGEVAERLEWCTKCNTYCPTVDLREINYQPDMDVMAIGLLHLDMVASGRKLKPLKQSFWNTF